MKDCFSDSEENYASEIPSSEVDEAFVDGKSISKGFIAGGASIWQYGKDGAL